MTPLIAAALLASQASSPLQAYELVPGYFVSLPAKPEEIHPPVPANAHPETGSRYWRVTSNGLIMVLSAFGFEAKGPETAPDRVLANMVAGLAHGAHGHVFSQQDILLNGWQGLDVQLRIAEKFGGWIRSYATDNRGFEIGVFSSRPDGQMPGVRAIFDSVKLPGPPGPNKTAGPVFRVYKHPDTTVSVLMPGAPEVAEIPLKNNPFHLTLHRASVSYGNRTYVALYSDLPTEELAKLTREQLGHVLDGINREIASGVGAASLTTRSYKLNGLNLNTSDFTAADGEAYARIDSFVLGHRFYGFLALVPIALRASVEVNRFFASINLATP